MTAGDVAAGVRAIGVRPGDVVMLHSSLKSMGYVVGGPNAVIDGFLQAVGPEGTVAVPTLWWNGTQDLSEAAASVRDGALWRVYHQSGGDVRYAESDDGIAWGKPDLDAVMVAGHKTNTIVGQGAEEGAAPYLQIGAVRTRRQQTAGPASPAGTRTYSMSSGPSHMT